MYFLKYWFRIIFNQNKLWTAALNKYSQTLHSGRKFHTVLLQYLREILFFRCIYFFEYVSEELREPEGIYTETFPHMTNTY